MARILVIQFQFAEIDVGANVVPDEFRADFGSLSTRTV